MRVGFAVVNETIPTTTAPPRRANDRGHDPRSSPLSAQQTSATIYALVDPRTDKIRYVGKTTWPLAHRLRTHMADATAKPHTRRARWVNGLRAEALRPTIRALEVVPTAEWETAERRWIRRLAHCDLTNATEGGEVGGWGWQAGEECAHARLTEAMVVDICERFAAGGVTQQQLADEHGVTIKAISLIVRGINWAHVERPLTFRGRGAKGVSRNRSNRHGAKDYMP
jgi:hypothetical protein